MLTNTQQSLRGCWQLSAAQRSASQRSAVQRVVSALASRLPLSRCLGAGFRKRGRGRVESALRLRHGTAPRQEFGPSLSCSGLLSCAKAHVSNALSRRPDFLRKPVNELCPKL